MSARQPWMSTNETVRGVPAAIESQTNGRHTIILFSERDDEGSLHHYVHISRRAGRDGYRAGWRLYRWDEDGGELHLEYPRGVHDVPAYVMRRALALARYYCPALGSRRTRLPKVDGRV